jgi:mannose-6-phosphate isomerase-like protein (cupin superfamily)
MNTIFPSGTGLRDIGNRKGSLEHGADNADRSLLLAHGDEKAGLIDTESVAVLTSMNKKVKSKRAGSIAWSKAKKGMPLYDQDAVQTLGGSTAVIRMDEGNSLRMGNNSLIIIRKVEEDKIFGEKRSFVVVMDGELKGKFSGNEYVEVTTPSAVAKIKNIEGSGKQSEFRIRVNPDKSSTFAVIKGSAKITAKGKTVELKHNQMTTVDLKKSPSMPISLPQPVKLVKPEGGELFYYRDLPPSILFTWNDKKNVDGYHFMIARDSNFEDVVYDERLLENKFSLGNLKNGSYYWRVSAVKNRGDGIFSDAREIQVARDIDPPELNIVSLPQTVYEDRFTVQGSTEQGVDLYVGGAPVHISPTGSFEYELLLEHGLNVFVVEAVDSVGNVAYFSQLINSKF